MNKLTQLVARLAIAVAMAGAGTAFGGGLPHWLNGANPAPAYACTGWTTVASREPDSHGNYVYHMQFNQCTRQVQVIVDGTGLCCVSSIRLWIWNGASWTKYTTQSFYLNNQTFGPIAMGCGWLAHVDYDWTDTYVSSDNYSSNGNPSNTFNC